MRSKYPLVAVRLSALTILAVAASGAAHAQDTTATTQSRNPGWYFGIEGFNSQVRDSSGTATATVTTAPVPAGGCPAGTAPLPGVGTSLSGLNALVTSGLSVLNVCLVPAAGSPTPSTRSTIPLGSTSMTFKSNFGGGFSIGYLFNGGFRPEFNFSYVQNDLKSYSLASSSTSGMSLTALRTMANAWYDLDFGIPVVPYLGGGVGAQFSKFDAGSGSRGNATTFAYQLGGGLNLWATNNLAVSLDYRYVLSSQPTFDYTSTITTGSGPVPAQISQQTNYRAQRIGLGLRYLFGEHGRAVLDSDGDGVPDYLDRCPNTPHGVQVDKNGCPLDSDHDGVPDYLDKCPNTPEGVQVDANGCPLDSDGDGVPDYLDKCPNTPKGVQVNKDGCPLASEMQLRKCPPPPAGVQVDAYGCPLDSDGDGIPDYLDECPHTPKGAKVLPNGCALKGDCRTPRPGEAVDANGCAASHNFILKGVKFEFDSARLTEQAQLILNDVAETLKAYPDVDVDVEGHTDYIGTDAYNLALSERRAISVKNYLVAHGVPDKRMTPVGYGKSRPIASNQTEEGREQNRRVELHVKD